MKLQHLVLCVFVMALASCKNRKPIENANIDFAVAQPLAEATHDKLVELSGLAASKKHPGLLWTHNDSGNDAEIYLVDQKLNIKLTCKLPGVTNRDWEDIAVGPGPDSTKTYVYVGEIGDNDAIYPLKHLYRFEEPDLDSTTQTLTLASFDTITFKFPDAIKDSEALMINPKTRDIYVLSKRENPVIVYTLPYPQSTTDTLTAEKLVSLPITQIVSASLSASGTEMLMKNYETIYYWNVGDKPLTEALATAPQQIEYDPEPQGEAITWAHDDAGFYTISEKNLGKSSYLYYYKRK
ncbi:hypothetical protein [Chryseolinea lacunae]|uniref:PE-PGRS family protein n=1 Tax=Chryseolinea lacunae TaxID=2801331 RepID=A0ABS1KQQ7_9BACT|nr:hypothetical protein [Chryseolinea lacunae]MBL0741638.1 hypothetical protein [Chryseolinea lacunae]